MEPQTQKRKSPDAAFAAAAAALCTNGCGFFGTAANKGMCSKCYRETAACQETDDAASVFAFAAVPPSPRKKMKMGVPAIGSSSAADAAAGAVDTSSAAAPATTTEQQKEEGPASRCVTCRKKVGLTGFLCRCGGTFCGPHRYSDAHSCGFDYKAHGREKIAKQNPVVVAPKLDKI